jgi:flagellar biosynthesis protein FliR
VAEAFAFAFTLAAPFLIAALVYNVALGAINKAMPQLMVAFIGAPAITAAGILILLLAGPLILTVWGGRLDELLVSPLGLAR